MHHVNGLVGAGPVWVQVMDFLHQTRPSTPPPRPEGVELAHNGEFYLRGTAPLSLHQEQRNFSPKVTLTQAKITYPADKMILAIDPDIPFSLQKIEFQNNSRGKELLRWRLNGQETKSTWDPKVGHYTLELMARDNQTKLDQVHFIVR